VTSSATQGGRKLKNSSLANYIGLFLRFGITSIGTYAITFLNEDPFDFFLHSTVCFVIAETVHIAIVGWKTAIVTDMQIEFGLYSVGIYILATYISEPITISVAAGILSLLVLPLLAASGLIGETLSGYLESREVQDKTKWMTRTALVAGGVLLADAINTDPFVIGMLAGLAYTVVDFVTKRVTTIDTLFHSPLAVRVCMVAASVLICKQTTLDGPLALIAVTAISCWIADYLLPKLKL
jgi:hypothetical protein